MDDITIKQSKESSELTPTTLTPSECINTNSDSNDNSFHKDINNISEAYQPRHQMDFASDRFPFSIVWTPLPLISWILPFIGHTGICA